MTKEEETYWSERWASRQTGWDVGNVSTPIKQYIDQLNNTNQAILIPGAGNAYEAEYVFAKGFTQVFILDIAKEPLDSFKARNPDFPTSQLLHGDFFSHQGKYDLILEQTFCCSFLPLKENGAAYTKKVAELLQPNGKLVGLWFKHALDPAGNRPFGGQKDEYLSYLQPYFQTVLFEDCHNSIPPRLGNELFGIFTKK